MISQSNIKKYQTELAKATTELERDKIYRSVFLLANRGHSVTTKLLKTEDMKPIVEKLLNG